jgi:hypothetical protein
MNRRFIIGIALLLLAAAAIAVWQILPKPDTRPVSTVKGFTGSEKVGLLNNPDIKRILSDRYRLNVDYRSAGSLEQVQIDSTGQDFMWPSNEVALEFYKEQHGGQANSALIFNSPIVFYSWNIVADALMQQRIVTQENSVYYIDDMIGFIQTLTVTDTNKQKSWKDLGLPQLYGKVAVISTDPTKSNSGNMFSGLMANMLNQGQVADDASLDRNLPTIKQYFASRGFLAQGSGDLFKSFYREGVGAHPIISGYESQLIEFVIQNNEADRKQILDQIRIIYPRPTVWSSHPMIALTSRGVELQKALQDPEIQKIAWEKHGFRSGFIGVQNDPKVLNIVGIPATITSVMPLPRPAVMQRLITELEK